MSWSDLKADLISYHIEGIAREGNTPFSCDLISHVEGNLWQGGCVNGVSLRGCFKHIISLYPLERFTPDCDLDSFTEVRLKDGPIIPNEKQLYALANWVNLCKGFGSTLVHCQAGLNRSALVTGLSLVLDGKTPDAAIKLMREKRCKAVLCNKKFEEWLLNQKGV